MYTEKRLNFPFIEMKTKSAEENLYRFLGRNKVTMNYFCALTFRNANSSWCFILPIAHCIAQ